MRSQLAGRLMAALIFQASIATAECPVLFDPVTTHANGMPLASVDPQRDGDLYSGCNRYHLGCCGGRFNTPLGQSIMNPKRCWNPLVEKRPVFATTTPGVAMPGGPAPVAFSGMEPAQSERLGPAPNIGMLSSN